MEKEDMEITPERADKIKQALIRQYEDQYGVEVVSCTEVRKGNNFVITAPKSGRS